MESIISRKKPVLAILREMEVGENTQFPAEKASYVKSACSQFGFEWNKKFETSNNREERTITVTRIA